MAAVLVRALTKPRRAALLLGVPLCVLGACTQRSVPGQVEAERWAIAWEGVLNSRSLAQVDGLFPETAMYRSPALPRAIPGHALGRHVAFYWRLFPRGRIHGREVHRGAGVIVMEWWAWPEPEPADQRWGGVTVLLLDQETVREVHTYFDPTVLLPYIWGRPR